MFTGMFVHPDHVLRVLSRCGFVYPGGRESDPFRGWTRFQVMPRLFRYFAELGRFPEPEEGVAFLLDNCDSPEDAADPRVVRRAQKLYLDFAREMHTYGLLAIFGRFSRVLYKAELDMSNVDFLVAINGEDFYVQCVMRAVWRARPERDPWSEIKEERRRRRGEADSSKIFYMTNERIPHVVGPANCWLFTERHVWALYEEIRQYAAGEIA